jgi:acid phosphatase
MPRTLARALALVLAPLVLGGCAATPPAAPPAPVAAVPAPPSLPESLRWVLTAAEYRAACLQTYRRATEALERAAAGRAAGTWAVSLDGDETVISNVAYERQLVEGGREHDEEIWSAWVERRAAPPLPGAVDFLRRVQELGGRVAIVTNRSQRDCPPTEDNFRRQGIPYDVMLCRPADGDREKEPRWAALERGTAAPGLPPLAILLWLGDNIQDFPDLDQTSARDPDRLADFGHRYFVLPNPLYGSWERNPVN